MTDNLIIVVLPLLPTYKSVTLPSLQPLFRLPFFVSIETQRTRIPYTFYFHVVYLSF